MGCGCNTTIQRVPSGNRRRGRRPWFSNREVAAGPCCEACGLGLECGSVVGSSSEYASEEHASEPRERSAGIGETTCERLRGESLEVYRARCGLDPTSMSADLWAQMNASERRTYLQSVAREAQLTARQEQQLIAGAVSGTFNTLLELLRTNRDIRLEEIRADRDVRIAQITGTRAGELDYLRWVDAQGRTTATNPGSSASSASSSSASTVETLGLVALGAKLLGLF